MHTNAQDGSTGFFRRDTKSRSRKDGEGDDFLDDFELRGGINRVAPAIGRHLQQIFEESDAPAHQNDEQQRLAFEFQVAVPRDRHENIRAGQQHNGQPAGLSQVVHKLGKGILRLARMRSKNLARRFAFACLHFIPDRAGYRAQHPPNRPSAIRVLSAPQHIR